MIKLTNHSPPVWEYPKYEPGEPVGLFIPCYIDQFFPASGEATVELLRRQNVPVEYPKEQTCCGQPAFNSGYWDEARRVVRHFCDTFEPYRWIVGPSGSCTAMCRVFFEQVDPDPRIVEIGRRVVELTEFLVNVLGVTDTGARYPHKVALHIGCHTRRELGVVDPPMTLLRSIRDLEYHELPNMEECCGFGGTFSVKMAGTSLAMGRTKVENLAKCGADVLVSPDTSCLMHIEGLLRRDPATRHIQTKHLAEILVADE
ncbi:MAG: (Fe-S)-binding protein [Pirellulales bacterium]|nr:(Fe-S)-binding protein [Pirellulales bacterium]